MANKKFLKIITVIIISILCINMCSTEVFADSSLEGIISGGDGFISAADKDVTYNKDMVNEASSTVYNMLFIIGMITAVVVGIVLGIKYMMGSVEEKAQMKETLVPYVIGCIIIFGAFAIWKIVVTVASSM